MILNGSSKQKDIWLKMPKGWIAYGVLVDNAEAKPTYRVSDADNIYVYSRASPPLPRFNF